jgi:hypothetical protein
LHEALAGEVRPENGWKPKFKAETGKSTTEITQSPLDSGNQTAMIASRANFLPCAEGSSPF